MVGEAVSTNQEVDGPAGWKVVGASFCGMYFSVGVLVLYSFGLLSSAIASDFGWPYARLAPLLGVFSITTMLVAPLYGNLIDRFSERRIALASSVALGFAFASISLLPRSLPAIYTAFVVVGVVGGGTLPAAYARIVVGWFERRRGVALSIAMTGVGVGAIGMPLMIALLLDVVAWRMTFVAIGLSVLVISVPVSLLWLRPRATEEKRVVLSTEAEASFLRSGTFWLLAAFAASAGVFVITGVGNFAPLLMDRGLSRGTAASYQAVVGISVIIARLSLGPLLDRFSAPLLMTVVFIASGCAMIYFFFTFNSVSILGAAIALGIAVGSEIDVLAYLVSRYFVRARFGIIFGATFSSYSFGGAIGTGLVSVLPHGSTLSVLIVAALLTAVMTLWMPRYQRI